MKYVNKRRQLMAVGNSRYINQKNLATTFEIYFQWGLAISIPFIAKYIYIYIYNYLLIYYDKLQIKLFLKIVWLRFIL